MRRILTGVALLLAPLATPLAAQCNNNNPLVGCAWYVDALRYHAQKDPASEIWLVNHAGWFVHRRASFHAIATRFFAPPGNPGSVAAAASRAVTVSVWAGDPAAGGVLRAAAVMHVDPTATGWQWVNLSTWLEPGDFIGFSGLAGLGANTATHGARLLPFRTGAGFQVADGDPRLMRPILRFQDTSTVPEPASLLLLGSGLAGLVLKRRRGRTPNDCASR